MLGNIRKLANRYNAHSAELAEGKVTERRLSQLQGCFLNDLAYEAALATEDSLIYRVTAIEPENSNGALHYGLGILYPGKIGNEYYLTKGHLHKTREASEVYIGLKGYGYLLLEDEITGESTLEPFGEDQIIYVPGNTAHRTINTGGEPLTYFGVYPANAGHDYGAIGKNNFAKIVVEENGKPTLKNRR